MQRRHFAYAIIGGAISSSLAAYSKDAEPDKDSAPRWGFLGDDDSLRATIKECSQVLLLCIYQTTLEEVKPPFATVVLKGTVIQAVKGTYKLGDKITLRFNTDSLPKEEADRAKFVEAAAAKNLGALKIAFLTGQQGVDYSCEWLDVPAYDADMLAFATKNSK
jgi:hypothetical protein